MLPFYQCSRSSKYVARERPAESGPGGIVSRCLFILLYLRRALGLIGAMANPLDGENGSHGDSSCSISHRGGSVNEMGRSKGARERSPGQQWSV